MRTYLVQENQKITASTILLSLKRDESERHLAFEPGQYASIGFSRNNKKSAVRCFSIVSSPTDQDRLQFSMRQRGRFTTALSKLEPGDIVYVAGPFGGFVFDVDKDKTAVLMAGGIGITPFMSMMRYLDKLNAENNVVLLYSVQNQEDVPFSDELIAIERRHPNLKTIFVVGKDSTDKLPQHSVASGYITPELLDKVTNAKYDEQRFFICGPPVLMKAMSALVMQKHVPKRRILTEAFTQSSPKQTSILRSWPANVYALGAISFALGSLAVMVSDLLKTLPPLSADQPTKTTPFFVTNARQKQLDQLVNSIPPSASLISLPTTQSSTAPTSTAPVTAPAPIYLAPPPRTTVSVPRP